MHLIKRMILVIFTSTLCLSGTLAVNGQSNTLQDIKRELQQKTKEKQSVNTEMEEIKKEMESLNTFIAKNKVEMANTQNKINAMNELIEKKKEEIVILEDKILNRKEIMKNKLVALQNDNNLSVVFNVLIEAKSFDDLVQRANAITVLLDADNNILEAQQEDLKSIEENKKEIDEQQRKLEEEQTLLAKQQADLNKNLQKRQVAFASVQKKYSQISKETSGIQAQLTAVQDAIRLEQEANTRAMAGNTISTTVPAGKEMYVMSTAYSSEEAGSVTRMGYNIKANPNMKLIAVDPTVIPLGKKVWVEGYGTAIAGDTGSAIKGHKIDVLMPTREKAIAWGRKAVKIVVLN